MQVVGRGDRQARGWWAERGDRVTEMVEELQLLVVTEARAAPESPSGTSSVMMH